MLIENFDHTIDFWIMELEQYSFTQLCTKPSSAAWSLGQLYIHLINDTRFYIEQLRNCIATNENADEEASAFAKAMFFNNEFPDEAIEGAPSNAYILQPDSTLQLMNDFLNLKADIRTVGQLIAENSSKGKTKHPGLGYFNADEWFQFAEMHLRHHVRQKKRIDRFLKMYPEQ
ncbi:DinB family protein [Runella sp.]|uniref:DinB family protein n=1 Tax=Runella sp. TaxID=1960881 RepID=UPI003D0FA86D